MFEPAFDISFAEPFPANVLRLAKLRWAEASTEVLGTTLAAFVDFTESVPADANLPCLTVEFKRIFNITNDENEIVNSTVEFMVAIADEDPDRDVLLKRLIKRARVVDAIIRSAAKWDSQDNNLLLANMPVASSGLLTLNIAEWVPGRNVPQGQRNVRAIGGLMSVSLMEA